jgi:excisionase family DNA binding protein
MKKLLSEAEVAEWLSVSKSTLYKLRESKEIPYITVGTCIRYSEDEIIEWINKNKK